MRERSRCVPRFSMPISSTLPATASWRSGKASRGVTFNGAVLGRWLRWLASRACCPAVKGSLRPRSPTRVVALWTRVGRISCRPRSRKCTRDALRRAEPVTIGREREGERTRVFAPLRCERTPRARTRSARPATRHGIERSNIRAAVGIGSQRTSQRARRLVQAREWNSAQSLAARSWERCERLGFGGLSAVAAAILGAADDARGDRAGGEFWRARAIERLLPTQDRVLASSLFPQPGYGRRHGSDRLLKAVLYERLTLIVPEMLGESPQRRAAVESWLATVVDAAILRDCGGDDLVRAGAMLVQSDCALVRYADRTRLPVAEIWRWPSWR